MKNFVAIRKITRIIKQSINTTSKAAFEKIINYFLQFFAKPKCTLCLITLQYTPEQEHLSLAKSSGEWPNGLRRYEWIGRYPVYSTQGDQLGLKT